MYIIYCTLCIFLYFTVNKNHILSIARILWFKVWLWFSNTVCTNALIDWWHSLFMPLLIFVLKRNIIPGTVCQISFLDYALLTSITILERLKLGLCLSFDAEGLFPIGFFFPKQTVWMPNSCREIILNYHKNKTRSNRV